MAHELSDSTTSLQTLIPHTRPAVPQARALAAPAVVARPLAQESFRVEFAYAGFGARALAMIIDIVILNSAMAMIQVPLI